MVKKTKVQSKRLESLRNIVLNVLYLYISRLPPVNLAKHQWGFSPFWLLVGQGQWEALVEDWRMGENEVCVFFSGFLLTELYQRLCFFPRPWFLKAFFIDAVPPAPYSFRSQRRQRLPLLPPQIIRNLMIPGGIISHVDFFYLCPMSINYSVIPLSLWSPFLRVPSVSASVWLLQVKEHKEETKFAASTCWL